MATDTHHVYMASNSRISIAGMNEGKVAYVAQALEETVRNEVRESMEGKSVFSWPASYCLYERSGVLGGERDIETTKTIKGLITIGKYQYQVSQ